MIEANTIDSWQTLSSDAAKFFCVSIPSIRSQVPFEHVPTYGNDMSSGRYTQAGMGISEPVLAFFAHGHTPFCFSRLS